MVEPHVRRRVYGAAIAILATAGLLLARLAAAPTAEGFRHALAPAPGGGAYAVEDGRAWLLATDGEARGLGRVPAGQPLALAADGATLVLGTDAGVAVSTDAGQTWNRAALPPGHYPAVWVSGSSLLVGQWAGRLWASDDVGDRWRPVGAPGGGEYQAIVEAGPWYVATLTGVWSSPDLRDWTQTSPVTRITALVVTSERLVVGGDWRGQRHNVTTFDVLLRLPALGAGIWSLAGGLAATTDGIRGGEQVLLPGREVTALVSAGGRLYAGLARGPVLMSGDGGASWRVVLHG